MDFRKGKLVWTRVDWHRFLKAGIEEFKFYNRNAMPTDIVVEGLTEFMEIPMEFEEAVLCGQCGKGKVDVEFDNEGEAKCNDCTMSAIDGAIAVVELHNEAQEEAQADVADGLSGAEGDAKPARAKRTSKHAESEQDQDV